MCPKEMGSPFSFVSTEKLVQANDLHITDAVDRN